VRAIYFDLLFNSPRACSNALALVPDGEQPRTRVVGPKLALMEKRIAELDRVTAKLVRSSSEIPIASFQEAYCSSESFFSGCDV
jgi:hypothetical protein